MLNATRARELTDTAIQKRQEELAAECIPYMNQIEAKIVQAANAGKSRVNVTYPDSYELQAFITGVLRDSGYEVEVSDLRNVYKIKW